MGIVAIQLPFFPCGAKEGRVDGLLASGRKLVGFSKLERIGRFKGIKGLAVVLSQAIIE